MNVWKKEGALNGKTDKRGQVTIFIIIAIVVVGAATAIYFLFPTSTTGSQADTDNPNAFIEQCLEQDISQTVETVSLQGGDLEPEFYFEFNGIPIKYLCYTNEDVKECVIQELSLKQNIESEIEENIRDYVETCFNALKESYNERGYNTDLKSGNFNVKIVPGRIETKFDYIFTLTRGESTERYDSFSVILNNNLYQQLDIANNIIENEVIPVGNPDVKIYMDLYPNLKVEKNLRDDGTRIYTLTERGTKNKFQFAVRSFVLSPGH